MLDLGRRAPLAVALFVALSSIVADAQIAPMQNEYRTSDLGFGAQINSSGGFQTAIPFDLPAMRGNLAPPFQIATGSRRVGAAGLGWDVPLSYVRVSDTFAGTKPLLSTVGETPEPRQRITLALGGSTASLIEAGGRWTAPVNAMTMSATETSDGWSVEDGQGHTYSFTIPSNAPSGYWPTGMWLLTSISSVGSQIATLSYNIDVISLGGVDYALSVELADVDYDISPNTGCGKYRIGLTYFTSEYPLAYSLLGVSDQVRVRISTVSSVAVLARTDCTTMTAIRTYQLSYTADVDTQLPQLTSVQMYGESGTTEGSAALPMATYHYGHVVTADGSGELAVRYDSGQPLPGAALVAGMGNPTQIKYSTVESLTDFNGDGVPDIVDEPHYEYSVLEDDDTQPLEISFGEVGSNGVNFAAPVPLGDSSALAGPLDSSTMSTVREFTRLGEPSEATIPNVEETWREEIDINGDGRMDLIDASACDGLWHVYLNSPSSGSSGITWQERAIPTDTIALYLTDNGHQLDGNCVPLTRRTTAQSWQTDANGGILPETVTPEITYTEWKLQDINGDGYPDFVYDLSPVSIVNNGNSHGPLAPAAIAVAYNVGGVDLSETTPRYMFSGGHLLVPSTNCAVEQWNADLDGGTSQVCGFLDINGDGVPERVENNVAYLGLGDRYADFQIPMPSFDDGYGDQIGVSLAYEKSNAQQDCTASDDGYAREATLNGLRDINGDGILDAIVNVGAGLEPGPFVLLGTGTGFGSPIPLEGGIAFQLWDIDQVYTSIPLTYGDGLCSSQDSFISMGAVDVDGDGKVDGYTTIGGSGFDVPLVSRLMGGTAPGIPEAGYLTQIDNGYGASTYIAYTSAKQDHLTPHLLPFPEIVVSSIGTTTSDTDQLAPLRATYYAYGNASQIYDDLAETWLFPGYLRAVSLYTGSGWTAQQQYGTVGEALVTDRLPLSPPDTSLEDEDRFQRRAVVGQVSSEALLSNVDANPWDLLDVNVATASPIGFERSDLYVASVFGDGASPPSDAGDCVGSLMDPYDYDASIGDAQLHYNECTTYGYAIPTREFRSRGEPASVSSVTLSSSSVTTETDLLNIDDFGRATDVQYKNDVTRADDDLCVTTTYAASTGSASVLDAVSREEIASCEGNLAVMSVATYDYDGLTNGSVGSGLLTGESLERHSLSDGGLIDTIRVFDATRDDVGNIVEETITTQPGSATEKVEYSYDPFGVAPTSMSITTATAPELRTTMTLDSVTLAPLSVTEPNQTQYGMMYDGFGRPVESKVVGGGASGVLSTTSYVGFTDSTGRRVLTTVFDDPTSLGSATGHTSTTYIDSLGRERQTVADLGVSYNESVVTHFREYDEMGRLAFEADPFVLGSDGTQAYGTSRNFDLDGTPTCFVRGSGYRDTDASDDSIETFPSCFAHGYANGEEVFATRDAAANDPGSPQYGVIKTDTRSAIGWKVSAATTQGSTFLEFAAFSEDRLGHIASMTRFRTPGDAASDSADPVQTQWQYDSLGSQLMETLPNGTNIDSTYDSSGEPTRVSWQDSSGISHSQVTTYDALGRVLHQEEQNGGVVDPDSLEDYQYDVAAGSATYEAGPPTNLLGRLSGASWSRGQVVLSYDDLGRVNAETYLDGSGIHYTDRYLFHATGALSSLVFNLPDDGYDDEILNYSYDSAGRATLITYGSASEPLYETGSLDPFGRVLSAAYGSGVASYSATYDASGRRLLTNATVERQVVTPQKRGLPLTTTCKKWMDYEAYDAEGREIQREEQSGCWIGTDPPTIPLGGRSPEPSIYTFVSSYDQLGRLEGQFASWTAGPALGGVGGSDEWAYAYDALGNMGLAQDAASASSDVQATFHTAGDLDTMCCVAYGSDGACRQESPCNVGYDELGEVTEEPSAGGAIRTFSYYPSGLPKSIDDGTNTASFFYGPLGAKEVDVSGDTTDARQDRYFGSLIEVLDQESETIVRKIPGPGGAVASLRGAGGDWVYGFGDNRGLRVAVTADDSPTNLRQWVSYAPYGGPDNSGASPGDPDYSSQQWNGGDALAAFGLVQLGARLYDPVIGRFMSRDPIIDTDTASHANPYAFAWNDPVNQGDPSGLQPQSDCSDGGCSGGGGGGSFFSFGGLVDTGSPGIREGARPPPPPPLVRDAMQMHIGPSVGDLFAWGKEIDQAENNAKNAIAGAPDALVNGMESGALTPWVKFLDLKNAMGGYSNPGVQSDWNPARDLAQEVAQPAPGAVSEFAYTLGEQFGQALSLELMSGGIGQFANLGNDAKLASGFEVGSKAGGELGGAAERFLGSSPKKTPRRA